MRHESLVALPLRRCKLRACRWVGPILPVRGRDHSYSSDVHPLGRRGDPGMTFTTYRVWLTVFVSFSLVVTSMLPGCNNRTGDLTGSITHKGRPVVSGSITAVGSD